MSTPEVAATVIEVLLWLVAIPAVLGCAYLLLLTLPSGALPVPPPSSRRMRFAVVVPAHDEAAVIERTVRSLLAVDWPRDRFRVIVVEHNCSDGTGAIARAAGADVLTHSDPAEGCKGDALVFAFADIVAGGQADAIVIVDADTVVSANLLEACAARLERGERAVQVHYGVLNPADSWRTRLLTIAKSCFHRVRSRSRERLGASCGVRGTGWCIAIDVLREVPYDAYSLTEDVEYGLQLGLAGIRVAYADEADADPEMVTGGVAAGKQRQRWEHGRRQLLRVLAPRLLREALRRPSLVCLDLALDLILPPISYVALLVLALAALGGALALAGGSAAPWLWLALACTAAMAAHVLRGWQLSKIGAEGLLDLARVPAFLLWKVALMMRPHDRRWERTDREQP